MSPLPNRSDYLIIGAGTAGCVLAARLTESGHSVILLEAGADVAGKIIPPDIASIYPLSLFNPSYSWPRTPVRWAGPAGPITNLQQGRVVGGGSAIMGMFATRGVPEDYDGWVQAGARGWGWDDVLPYFVRLESDADFDGPAHGCQGPIPIMREATESLPPFAHCVAKAASAMGFDLIDDVNANFDDGYCALPFSRTPTQRGASGIGYLTAEVRARPQLLIEDGIEVSRLLFDGKRAIGAATGGLGEPEREIHAHRTILCAGALRSPELLLRSGIGPGAALRAAEIEIVADRPGVGQNLQNHAMLYPLTLLTPRGRSLVAPRPMGAGMLRFSSGAPGSHRGDMAIYVNVGLSWHGLGQRLASLSPALMAPASRGWVRLNSRAPAGPPDIVFNLLEDQRDVERLESAFRMATRLIDWAAEERMCARPFVLSMTEEMAGANLRTWKNRLSGMLGGAIADVAPALLLNNLRRAAGLRRIEKDWDDDAIRKLTLQAVTGAAHVAGTCRMGAANDSLSVTGADGAVHGVEELFVADASIMPSVPSGSTHIPTVMVAEKISDGLRTR